MKNLNRILLAIKGTGPVFRQLISEYWLPLLLAVSWVGYNVLDSSAKQWDWKGVVNLFAPTFFIVSTYTAQWHRVRKQQKVDSSLSKVEQRIEHAIQRLEATAADSIAMSTGGDSFCYLMGRPDAPPLVCIHSGKFPLYDLTVRIVKDLPPGGGSMTPEQTRAFLASVPLGTLGAGQSFLTDMKLMGTGPSRIHRVDFNARNGGFHQVLRFELVNQDWELATKVTRNGKVLHKEVSPKFPVHLLEQGW